MTTKRNTYNLPEPLNDVFQNWKPGGPDARTASPEIAGALFFWMKIPADVREELKKQANKKDIDKAYIEFWTIVMNSMKDMSAFKSFAQARASIESKNVAAAIQAVDDAFAEHGIKPKHKRKTKSKR